MAKSGSANRYLRHKTLAGFGQVGQRTLQSSKVLVIGLGGLGRPVIQFLVGSGVGYLSINDFDRVDSTNLARQLLYRPEDVGQRKADVISAWIQRNNTDVAVQSLVQRLNHKELSELTQQVDVVVDCTDNIATRIQVAETCAQSRTPLVFGAAAGWQGQYAVFRYDQDSPADFSAVLSERDEWLEDCQGSGVFAPVLGVVGAAMAGETIKLLIGAGDSGVLLRLFDHRQGWRELSLAL